MPRRDGSGPMGQGAMTGRGVGYCSGANVPFRGYARRGCGLGLGRGGGGGFFRGQGYGFYAAEPWADQLDKETLTNEKQILKQRLKDIDARLAQGGTE